VNIQDTYQTSNIYVPGLSRPAIPEKHPESHSIYTDREVALLPQPGSSHPRLPEWAGRDASSRRLVRYLSMYKKAAGILEIGCGNGWLSSQLATVPGSKVLGLDLNFTGLQQAARVFGYQPNLKFMYGDFRSGILQGLSFDIIVFAASIQYFPSLKEILGTALKQLNKNGEIHILDTRFYRPEELEAARQSTTAYYISLGFPEMTRHIFHPCIRDLEGFQYRYAYHPHSFWSRLFDKKKGFPWICVSPSNP
jgi:ubiquinone/menaquinone biosynthesis C-methylase UbiE